MFGRAFSSIGIVLGLILSLAVVSSTGAGLIQEVEEAGTVDWGRMMIRCTGVGGASADTTSADQHAAVIKSARSDALDRILRTLRATPITSETTVGQVMDADNGMRQRVRVLARNFREKSIHYMSDGSVEIDVELSLRGELVDLLLPPSGGGKRISDGLLCPLCGQPWPQDREVPADLKLVSPQGGPAEAFTGLVIDARGLGFRPALAPRVLNEMGKTIYGVGFTRRSRALLSGVVSYDGYLDLATKKNRVAPNPLVIKGLKAAGGGKSDIVIKGAPAALLHSLPEHLQFMEECRVIIVLD